MSVPARVPCATDPALAIVCMKEDFLGAMYRSGTDRDGDHVCKGGVA